MLHWMQHLPRTVHRPPWLALSLLFAWLLALAGPADGRDRAAAQTSVPPLPPAARFGGPLTALAPTGDLVWLAQGRRVWAVDLADPERSKDRGPGLSLPRDVVALAAQGSLGLAAAGPELWALDLSNPDAPRPVGSLLLAPPADQTEATVERILLFDRKAYLRLSGRAADLVVDLQTATPRLAPGAPFALPAGAIVEDLQAVGDLVAVQVWEPSGMGVPAQESIRFYDRPLLPSGQLRGRIALMADAWRVLREGGQDRLLALVPLPPEVDRAYRWQLWTWDLTDPRAPKPIKGQLVASPEKVPSMCWNAESPPVLTSDGRLLIACRVQHGSFQVNGALLRWDPVGAEQGDPWNTVHLALHPFDRPIVAEGPRVLAVGGEGLHAFHSPATLSLIHPLITDAAGLAADRIQGQPSLLVNAGGLRRLSLVQPLNPVLAAPEAFYPGRTGQVSVGDGMAVIDGYGAGDILTQALKVADLSGPEAFRDIGGVDLTRGGSRALWAQAGSQLAAAVTPQSVGLFFLDRLLGPRPKGELAVRGGQVVALAMDGDLLAVLCLAETSTNPAALSPLTLSLYWVRSVGDALDATLLASRLVAPDASAVASSHGLRMGRGWLAVGMTLRCGVQRSQGILMLRLGQQPDAASLAPWAWLPNLGQALLLHDGYLFARGTSAVNGPLPDDVRIIDIRRLAELPWAWREVGRLEAERPGAMAVWDRTLYVSMGEAGIAIFRPDLPWASDPAAPSPTDPPTPPPLTPTLPSMACLSPTPSSTPPPTATATRTVPASRTASPAASATATPAIDQRRRLSLPLLGAGWLRDLNRADHQERRMPGAGGR